MREFEVVANQPTTWPTMTDPARVVTQFLSHVRVTADASAAQRLMHETVRCHQVVAERPHTVLRTPHDYAEHVRHMQELFGAFTYHVTELLTDADHVYVRWRQRGHHLRNEDGTPGTGAPIQEVGSAVYRVEDGRIAEYWVQLDRLGLATQLQQSRLAGRA
ncbi:MAG TPA: ester cyclase [Nocardioidaceae bacterium]|nr:ester cyclase [Nocardioidaceae bacterium]